MKNRLQLWFYARVACSLHGVSRWFDRCAFRAGRRAARANLHLLNLPTLER